MSKAVHACDLSQKCQCFLPHAIAGTILKFVPQEINNDLVNNFDEILLNEISTCESRMVAKRETLWKH